jgi:hypothetical protein
VTEAPRDGAPEAAAEGAPAGGTRCLNCDAALHGPFCAQCGQRALPPRPTVRELAGEAWQEFVNLDGKVATTLRLLVMRPGFLTADSLAGRRARYIGPLRLYLVCSLAYFFATATLPDPAHKTRTTATASGGVRISRGTASDAAAAPKATPASCEPRKPSESDFEWRVRSMDCRSDRDPAAFERAMRQNMPRMMFVMLPVYAAILGLFFRGPTFPEHLYFALHLHAFVFLALLLERLGDVWPGGKWDGRLGFALVVWVVVYSVAALRRVYGRGRGSTIARSVGVAAVYAFVFVLALIALLAVTALTL